MPKTLNSPSNGAVITPPRAPDYLWLFEAVIQLRLQTGCSHEFAVTEFQALYPGINVQRQLERAVTELMRLMQPYYDAKVGEGWMPAVKNGRLERCH